MPGIGTLVRVAGAGDLFDAFGSAWRYTGLGSANPAPFLLALMGGFGTVLFGSVGLARTLVVVAAMPLGAFGAYRFTRRLVGLRGPTFAAGIAYGVNPVTTQRDRHRSIRPARAVRVVAVRARANRPLAGLDRDATRGDRSTTTATSR